MEATTRRTSSPLTPLPPLPGIGARPALPAARWPRTTSSSVAGRPGPAAPRTSASELPLLVREPADEPAGIDRAVAVRHAVHGARLLHRHVEELPPAPQDEQPVAGLLDVGDDVGAEQRRGAGLADRVDHHVQELAPGERVQRRQRLVEEQHRRPGPERDREAHLRLLAARELVGADVERDVELVSRSSAAPRSKPARQRAAIARWSATVSSR